MATAQSPKPRSYEDVERELAVCKLVLFNTYTADVLADLLSMYGSLVKQHTAEVSQLTIITPESDSAEIEHVGTKQLVDVEVQTDAVAETDGPTEQSTGEPAECSTDHHTDASEQIEADGSSRWDLEFFSQQQEQEFGKWFNSWTLLTDLLQAVVLCLLLVVGASWQGSKVGTDALGAVGSLAGVLRSVLTGYVWFVLGVCCCAVYVPSYRTWYQSNREMMVAMLRTILAMFALPAGQLLWNTAPHLQAPAARNVCGSMAHLALWAVPALTFRIRFSRHLFLQTAVLCMTTSSTVFEYIAHQAASGQTSSGHGQLLRQLVLMVLAGHLLPTGLVYLSELRVRSYLVSNAHAEVEGCSKGVQGPHMSHTYATCYDSGKGCAATDSLDAAAMGQPMQWKAACAGSVVDAGW